MKAMEDSFDREYGFSELQIDENLQQLGEAESEGWLESAEREYGVGAVANGELHC